MNSNYSKMDYVIIKGKIDYILSSCPNEINIKEYSTLLKQNNVKFVNFCKSIFFKVLIILNMKSLECDHTN